MRSSIKGPAAEVDRPLQMTCYFASQSLRQGPLLLLALSVRCQSAQAHCKIPIGLAHIGPQILA
jgi:hypothetical protein